MIRTNKFKLDQFEKFKLSNLQAQTVKGGTDAADAAEKDIVIEDELYG